MKALIVAVLLLVLVICITEAQGPRRRWNRNFVEEGPVKPWKGKKVGGPQRGWRGGEWKKRGGCRHHKGGRILLKLLKCAYINDTQVDTFQKMALAITSNETLDEAIKDLPAQEQGDIKNILTCVGRRKWSRKTTDPEKVVEFIRAIINVEKQSKCVREFGDQCKTNAKEPMEWAMCLRWNCKRSQWKKEENFDDEEEEEEDEIDFNVIDL